LPAVILNSISGPWSNGMPDRMSGFGVLISQ